MLVVTMACVFRGVGGGLPFQDRCWRWLFFTERESLY